MSSSEWEELEKYVCQHSMKFSPQLTSVTVLPVCLYPQSQLNAVFPPKIFDATLFVMLKVVKNKLEQKVM